MHPLPLGATFADRFLVDEALGLGAAGAVVGARDMERAGARVAVKILRPELAADATLRARFRREAAVLQELRDPAIVAVLGHGEAALSEHAPLLPYLVMERLGGRTLRDALAEGPQSPERVWRWLSPLASALGRVHAAGVLHGDLKPDNIFLTPSGPRLVDFGSAKVHGFPRLTATGELAGTPLYMAPEVIAGERSLDARADVYALGVTVFESIAGQPPFRARHPGRLLTEIMNGDRPPLTAFATRAEGDTEAKANRAAIDQVLATAMHRRPAQRFESVRAFASALGALRAAQVSGAEDESGGDVPRAR